VSSQALNMTSLTFFSMFKQFYSKFDKPSMTPISTTPYLSYTTLTWAHKCNSYTKAIYFNNGPNTNCVT